ncbi:hypothetical protein Tsubulata_010680 [Turnera subulata]|uniref:DUF4283 domain-containing protein n=1 Tax=Turnera subulata TaxID=218843 RepID=A0A9Q0GEU1_9ROSI|nr:hypothetical protein Tsubulata_010680 [Turnera subulata]
MAASSSTMQIDKGKGIAIEPLEEEVLLLDATELEAIDPLHYLLTRVLGSKHLGYRALTNVMRGLWSPSKGMEITQLESTLFLLQFNSKRDLSMVLKAEPWCFDKQLILLKQVFGTEHFHNVALQHCPFWLQIYDVAMTFLTESQIKLSANWNGVFSGFYERGPLGWGKYIRVSVILDVTKPLKRAI